MALIADLDIHPEKSRILKLLYFVVHQHWVTHDSMLMNHSIQGLCQELMQQTPEDIESRLIQSAMKLNKPQTYLKLAHLITGALQPSSEPPTSELDHFGLRFALHQGLNPYKAKILLYGLMQVSEENREGPEPSQAELPQLTPPQIEQALKPYSLDQLCQQVMIRFPTPSSLRHACQRLPHLSLFGPYAEQLQLIQTLSSILSPHLAPAVSSPRSQSQPEAQAEDAQVRDAQVRDAQVRSAQSTLTEDHTCLMMSVIGPPPFPRRCSTL
ncbi:hypothetical protein [Lyngbya confervoides]|uniref:Uncharacterized protein n=1 Tax=Lyngbya confervoides BDU141951 TaxID=1574623 RepID=A0ABD4SYZ4_9CYAN|nr:hypothetical protein [Lyngbya confervoides]MCM1981588.1 hypothetical protein [Lyngbya confervoides BDU141951]